MAIRSFQQIINAHEAAQEMLRNLEIAVRDAMAYAKAELERFSRRPVPVGDWALGSTFVALCDDIDMTTGRVYTLVYNWKENSAKYPFAFADDEGNMRVFYSFWLNQVERLT